MTIEPKIWKMPMPDLRFDPDTYYVPSLEFIANAVCRYFKITIEELKSQNRHCPIPDAKRMFSFFANRHYSLYDTGKFIGIAHSTVHTNRQKALVLLENHSEWKLRQRTEWIAYYLYGNRYNQPTPNEFREKAIERLSQSGKNIGRNKLGKYTKKQVV